MFMRLSSVHLSLLNKPLELRLEMILDIRVAQQGLQHRRFSRHLVPLTHSCRKDIVIQEIDHPTKEVQDILRRKTRRISRSRCDGRV
ncbi:hypothetical protein VNO77_32299 [Canavalia gladiata]|uniref:Uncharacterized protein n=1 Tax=Canavalia gladiata TaxID=3824 RepID=A0AAN9Q509_CANGL